MTTFDQATRAALATWANEEGQADESRMAKAFARGLAVLAGGGEGFDLDELLRLERAAPTTGLGDHQVFFYKNEATSFYAAARNAIPLLPAFIARQRAEAKREALEAAINAIEAEMERRHQQTLVPGAVGCHVGDLMSSAGMGALSESFDLVRAFLTEPTP